MDRKRLLRALIEDSRWMPPGVARPCACAWGAIVADYGQRFTYEKLYQDQKNKPGEGFHFACVKLGTAERRDRLWLVFAWAYYWLNVAGWDIEV